MAAKLILNITEFTEQTSLYRPRRHKILLTL
jgi:hypothetical protein